MDPLPEYERYDGLGLAELVRVGAVTPRELVEAAWARLERWNPHLNAVIHHLDEEARRTAAGPLPDGPFRGVPFLVKDLLEAVAGAPLSNGSRAYRGFVPTEDAEVVRRYRRAGLVFLGKTNVPEFGLLAVTEPEAFGPCRNPWARDRTPGGSSGGSAAAVAARIVPLASASDGGGSIRIPASHCGLFGLKPSRGRTPKGPLYGAIWFGAAEFGVLTRSVRDAAAALDLLAVPDRGAPYRIEPPAGSYRAVLERDPSSLRIGWTARSPLGAPVHPACVHAVERTATLLAELGHRVEEAAPPLEALPWSRAFLVALCAAVAAEVRRLVAWRGRGVVRALEAPTRMLGLLGEATPAAEFAHALETWDALARVYAAFFDRYDTLLTPTVACPPTRIGELAPRRHERLLLAVLNTLRAGRLYRAAHVLDRLAYEHLAAVPFTPPVNLAGLPAMSVPLHWTSDGLPIGAHIVAPFGEEARLFALAAQLERAAPWADRAPPPP